MTFISEIGAIHNATSTIAAGDIRNLPELHGTADVRTDIPKLYLPDIPPMLSVGEELRVKEMTLPETASNHVWQRRRRSGTLTRCYIYGRLHYNKQITHTVI